MIQANKQTNAVLSCLLRILLLYKHDVRYKNSPRYLRLWITYIFYLHTPLIYPILFGLIDNRIGDKLALLYEAIAYQQLKERRFRDVEATLLLGIRRKAYPLGKLNRVLQEYKSTGSLHFDVNQHTLDSYQTSNPINQQDMHATNEPDVNEPLKCHLNRINLKLQHAARADVLRRCSKHHYSYEELRAKTHCNGLIYNAFNMGQCIKKGGSNIIRGFTFHLQKEAPAIIPHYSNKVIPVQEKESDHQQVVQLPHNPGFIAHQLMLSGVIDRGTYHFLDKSSAQNDILIKLRNWFHGKAYNVQEKPIMLDKDSFHVVCQLGQGGLADVYLVQHSETSAYYGLKVQQPAHPWEYYILCQIHNRKSTDINVLGVYDFYHYSDASFLLMQLIRNGTLLDALNLYRPAKCCMPEPIVVIITTHLLEELIKLHRIQIAHNDLKLDNIMLVSSSGERNAEFPRIMMIDFGHSIDVSALPPRSLCKANWLPACPRSDFPKLNQPYSPFHADYWQLAAMAHLLLYGTPMLTSKNQSEHYTILQPIRRYWQKEIWTEFFQTLLNPTLSSENAKLQTLLRQFQQASRGVPQNEINSFTAMLEDKVFAK
ncbi:BUB protein kinase [Mucor circinelloides 1006PhL]|uniref:BUB protein kinase n=1 Tax=Mucor circinelloides f. circinelloides (strain 1006PhL) TaxID=1220926 RepID=S2JC70_MUCC1|nr:BUB protein kinase [Mucor circinelloides 1006PhL]